MSGFVAIANSDHRPVNAALLRHMTDELAVRALDERSVWSDGPIGMGHALLRSTFESAQETQPCSLDGQTWITGDVRLDARDELVASLGAAGRQASCDRPDVELVLHAWRVWGESCLDHLSGDFAFALWDGHARKLFCARDHFGIAPFYYAQVKDGLLVGNAIASLRAHPQVSDRLNDQAVGDFLVFRMNRSKETTVFADIQRLPPGYKLTWSQGRMRVQPYWTAEPVDTSRCLRLKRPEEYAERFHDVLAKAVADRLRTDKVGVHLSGGLDSSSVAALANEALRASGRPYDLRAYTMTFERVIFDDEAKFAALTAEKLSLPWERVVCEEHMEQSLLAGEGHCPPEPANTGRSADLEACRRTAAFGRVVLAGYGGDAVLLHDPAYRARLLAQGQWWPFVQSLVHQAIMVRCLPKPGIRSALRSLRGQSKQRPLPPDAALDEFRSDFAAKSQLEATIESYLAENARHRRGEENCSDPMWTGIFTLYDAEFSGVAVRVRYPFFDRRVMRCAAETPPVPWLEHKMLLRKAMQGLLPRQVLVRRKTGLRANPHLGHLRKHGMQPWMKELLAMPQLGEYVDVGRVMQNIDSPGPATAVRTGNILIFAHWLRHQNLADRRRLPGPTSNAA